MKRILQSFFLAVMFSFISAAPGLAQTLLSQGKPVTASSTDPTYPASNAVDGSITTKWSSSTTSYIQTLAVDLQATYDIDKVLIRFADGWYAVTFDIQASSDGINYTTIRTIPPGNTLSALWIIGLHTNTRYIRFQGRGRANIAGYRISQFEVYGYATTTSTQLASMATINNKLVPKYAAEEVSNLEVYITSMDTTTGAWPIDYSGTAWTSHALRLARIARAYRNPNNSLYNDARVPDRFMRGIRFYINSHFQSPTNWHDTCVRAPQNITIGLMMMKGAIPTDSLFLYAADLQDFSSEGRHKATNKIWVSQNTIRKGFVVDRYPVSLTGYTNFAAALDMTPLSAAEEGMRIDSSFHQHHFQLQSGSYGREFIEEAIDYTLLAQNTLFASLITSTHRTNIRNLMLGGYQLLGYRNSIDFGAIGRAVSGPGSLTNIPSSVLDSQIVNDPTKAAQYNAWKSNLTGGPFPVIRAKYFWNSGILTSHGANYYLSAKIMSVRNTGAERLNGESLKTFNLPWGATNIMTSGTEYYDIFPTWNWSRIPGTTTEMSEAAAAMADGYVNSTNTFGGGLSVNEAGAIAFKLDNTKGVTGRKAYFFMENAMLCLGNSITAVKTNEVVTTINQTKSVGPITYNSPSTTLTVDSISSNTLNWVQHDNVGYLFPNGGYFSLTNKTQTGTWRSINTKGTTTVQSNLMFNLYVRHSPTPTNRTYYYIVAPNKTASDMATYATNHGFAMVSNTSTIQAVQHTATNQSSVVFYAAGQVTMPDGLIIKSDKPAIVFVKKYSTNYRVSVGDPEYTGSPIVITLNKNLTGPGAVYANGETAITFSTYSGDDRGKTNTGFFNINAGSLMAQGDGGISLNSMLESDTDSDKSVVLYPNPSSAVMTIKGVSKDAKIEVYNISGHRYKTVTGNTVDVRELPAGSGYFLRINDHGKILQRHFIKE